MLLRCFAVWDVKAEAFMRPFFAVTAGSAIRGFSDAVNAPDSEIAKHPEDYTLFEVGTFDDHSGLMRPPEKGPVNLGIALSYKAGTT